MPADPSLFLSPLAGPERRAEGSERRDRDEPAVPPAGPERRADGSDRWERVRPPVPPADVAPRPVRGRSGRVLAVAAVAGLLVAGAVTNRLRSDEWAPRAGSPASTGPVAEAPATPSPPLPAAPVTPPAAAPLAPLETVARLGPRLPRPTGTALALVEDGRVLVADLDTGVVRTTALAPGAGRGLPSQVVVPSGDVLLVGGLTTTQVVPRAPGAPGAALAQPAAAGILPSTRPGTFWTITAGPRAELVERALDGAEARRLVLPEGSGPVLPAGDGFLVSSGGRVMALDADTGEEEPLADGVAVASAGRTLARSTCGGAPDCGLVLGDLRGGRERLVGAPTPRSQYATSGGATSSPDGRWLVIPFAGADQPGGLVLIDVERGERRPVAGLTTASGGGFPASAAFNDDSSWLLFTDRSEQTGGLKAVDLTDGTVVPVDLDLPGGVDGRQGALVLAAFPAIPADADPGR